MRIQPKDRKALQTGTIRVKTKTVTLYQSYGLYVAKADNFDTVFICQINR